VEAFKDKTAFLNTIQEGLGSAGQSILSPLFSIFGGAFSTLLIIFVAFFVSLEKNLMERIISIFAPPAYQEYFYNLARRAKQQVSSWFISRLIGMAFVGILTYLILLILNVKYAPLLALFAGIADFIPVIGTFFAGLVMAMVVAFNSFFQALFVVAAFSIIHILENNLLSPLLFKKLAGVPPLLVMISLAVGGKLWGVWGAILVVPLAGILYEVLKDYLAKKEMMRAA